MVKKIIAILLLLVWCSFIFYNSSLNGEVSGGTSDRLIADVISHVTNIKKGTDKMDNLVSKISFPIRKCAHFLEYFVLAILFSEVLYLFGVKKYLIIYSIIFCLLYAIGDEVHQMFSDGRSPMVADVLLDTSSSCLSSYLFYYLFIMRYGHEKKNN